MYLCETSQARDMGTADASSCTAARTGIELSRRALGRWCIN